MCRWCGLDPERSQRRARIGRASRWHTCYAFVRMLLVAVVASRFLPTTVLECVVLVRTRTHTGSCVADVLSAIGIETMSVEGKDSLCMKSRDRLRLPADVAKSTLRSIGGQSLLLMDWLLDRRIGFGRLTRCPYLYVDESRLLHDVSSRTQAFRRSSRAMANVVSC